MRIIRGGKKKKKKTILAKGREGDMNEQREYIRKELCQECMFVCSDPKWYKTCGILLLKPERISPGRSVNGPRGETK